MDETQQKCEECFNNITKRSNDVFKDFEIKSENAIKNFIGETSDMFTHLKAESAAYFADREEKSDLFYEKQEKKYDKLESKLTGMVKWTLGIVLFIVTIYGGVIASTFANNTDKADKKDYLSLKDAYILRTLGDKYYDQRYVLKPGESIDKYTYQWHMNIIFEEIHRGTSLKDSLMPMNKQF